MDSVFYNSSLESKFTERGFVELHGLLGLEEIAAINQYFVANDQESGVKALLYTSNNSKNKDYRIKASKFIQSVLFEKVARYITGYKAVYAHFIVKNPGPGSEFKVHQDWTVVDENHFRAVTIWVPLIDVNSNNGYMQFLPGSHLVSGNVRGSNIFTEVGELPEELYTGLELKAGDGIAFDERVFHKSVDNKSGVPRIAIAMILIPQQASVIHYFKYPEKEVVEKYILSDSFLEEFSVGDDIAPYAMQKSEVVTMEKTMLTSKELLQRLGDLTLSRNIF